MENLAELIGAVKLGHRETIVEMIKEEIKVEQNKLTMSDDKENVIGALRAYYKVIEMLENYKEE